MHLRRAATSLVAAFSLGVAQGCVTYAHPRPMSLPAGADVVLTSGAEPMRVIFPAASVGAERITCRASRIDGYSTAWRADTVPFAWIAGLTPALPGDTACRVQPTAVVVRSGTTTVRTVERDARDIVLLAVVVAATVAVVAFFSRYDPGLPIHNPNHSPAP